MKSRIPGLLALALWGCEGERVAGGTSSEVPNALTGIVVDSRGIAAARCLVTRTASDATADSGFGADTAWTDATGRWALPARNGRWSLLFQHSGELALVQEPAATSIPLRLSSGGWISGIVGPGFTKGRVYLQGTGLWAQADSTGAFLLGPVPAGNLPIVLKADSAGVERTLRDIVRILPAEVRSTGIWFSSAWDGEDYALWPSARLAVLDLTSQGADVSGDQIRFPIPVRLDSVLDLSTTRPEDIRFDDELGHHLPFFVSEWNTTSNTALAWVRLDTANGNSAKHFLRIHWGRKAGSPTGMPGIFSVANDFLGAWGGPTERDAGSLAIHWTSTGTIEGPVGSARATGESSSFSTDSVTLGGSASWTVSLWVRLDRKPSGEILLAGFDSGADSSRWGLSVKDDQTVRVWSGADPSGELLSNSPIPTGTWVHLAATFEAGTQRRIGLVVGNEVHDRQRVVYPTASRQPIRGARSFRGAIDEIRLSTTAREGSWSQLESRTQAPGVPWLRWQ